MNGAAHELRVHWTNEAQRQRAVEVFGFGKVPEKRTYHVAIDVARRLQAAALKVTGQTVGELMRDNLRVRSRASLPNGAMLCVLERLGAEPVVEAHAWPSDRRVPTEAELEAAG
jgi:hypothetical protein